MASIYDFLPPGTREQAGYAGLGALAQALLQGGAPTTTPGAGISALGAGFGGFGQAYNSRLNSGLQQAGMAQQLAQAQRQEEKQKAQEAAISQFFAPPPVQMAMAGNGQPGPTMAAAAKAQPPIAQMFPGADVNTLRTFAQANPEAFMGAVAQRMMPQPRSPVAVAPGAALVDPQTGKPIFTAPDKPQAQTEYDKLVADAQGNDPYRRQIARDILSRRGMPPTSTMTVNTGDKGLTDLDVKTIGEYETNLRKSRSLLPDLDRLEAAVRMFPTGVGGSQVLAFKQAADRLGWKVEGTSEGEIIQSIQSRLAPAMRPEGSGSSSDRDVQMFLDSLPNLFKTQGGNLKVISHLRRIATRQQQEAAFMRKYFRENGNKLDGVYEAMDKQLGPMFPRPKTETEMRSLQSGEVFMAPDGTMRVVP
jgi:hypothetical protein